MKFHVLHFHVLHFHVLQFHAVQLGPSFLCPAISCPAIWSVIFMSCNFMSVIFSAPAKFSAVPVHHYREHQQTTHCGPPRYSANNKLYVQVNTEIINHLALHSYVVYTLWFKKNAPTLADYNYDPVQSILIMFGKLFVNDHKSCLVVKFSTSPHTCCHYTLWNTMLYFALITLLIAKKCANFGSP